MKTSTKYISTTHYTIVKTFFRIPALIAVIMALTPVFLTTSCDDDTATIGSAIMPSRDGVSSSISTYKITSKTVLSDSVLANTSDSYLGCVIDPETRAKTTSNMLAQFNVLSNSSFPNYDRLFFNEDGSITVDSCAIRIYYTSYYGDSLNTMKVKVHELDTAKVISEDDKIYSNLDASEYFTEGIGETASVSYTAHDLSREDENIDYSTYSRSIVVPLSVDYGRWLMERYYENADYYRNSYMFIHHVCPGFYFENTGGVGSMIDASSAVLDVYFRYKAYTDEGTDTIISGMQRLAATEEVLQQTIIDQEIPESMLDENNDFTYIKSPAGLFTELTLPVDSVVAGDHYNDTINVASITISRYNNSTQNAYNLDPPSYILMVRKDKAYQFFEDNELSNSYDSYITSYSSTYSAYSFSDISRLLTVLKDERDEGAGVVVGEDEESRKAKYAVWEAENPNWNKVYLIPVDADYSTGTTTTYLLGVKNLMGMSSVKLQGGPSGNISMTVVYSRFANN